MAINKKLLHFVSKANFSTQLANSNIDSKSIVFIKDTGEIWTHDKLYSCASWGTNQTNYVPLTIGGTSYNISKDGHTHSYLPLSGGTLTGNIILKGSTSADMTDANIHPRLRFDNSDSSQTVSFIFTDYDTYRTPAGIKLVGNQGNEWFEAPKLIKTGSSDNYVLLGGGGHKAVSTFTPSLVTSTTSTGITNVATTNTNTYLNIVQGGASTGSSTQVIGANGVTVASDTTGKLTITGLGAHAGIYSSRANGLGASSNSIETKDTRSINPLPNTDLQRGVWFDFKINSAIGLTGASTYSSVITMVPYGDSSGNSNASFRLAQSGNNLYFQNWTTVWGTWNKIYHTGNFANGTTAQYIRGDGSLATYSDTTYSTGTLAQLNAGTDTTGRLQTAKLLNDWLNPKLNGKLDKTGGTLTGNLRLYNNNWGLKDIDYTVLALTPPTHTGGPWNHILKDDSSKAYYTLAYNLTKVFTVNSSGTTTILGTVTAPTFVGALSGNASTATALTSSSGSNTNPIYFSSGKPKASTYSFGNASGNIPISNGTLNTNLNADLLDGYHIASIPLKSDLLGNGISVSGFSSVAGGPLYVADKYIGVSGYDGQPSVILVAPIEDAGTTKENWSGCIGRFTFERGSTTAGLCQGYADVGLVKAYSTTSGYVLSNLNCKVGYCVYNSQMYLAIHFFTAYSYFGISFSGRYSGNCVFNRVPYSSVTGWTDLGSRLTHNGVGLATIDSNVYSATKLQTARTIWGQSFNGSGNVSGALSGVTTISASSTITAPTFIGNLNGNASTATRIAASVSGTNVIELVRGNIAGNDFFRILVGGTATNAGYVEIATADDGTEPIYVRQYSGTFTSLVRTATLLDASGNTSFPGTVTGSRFYTGYDSGVANSMSCSNWFRSNGATGWINASYGGGIYQNDSTYVKVYGSKAFKVTSTANDSINTDGGIQASGNITTRAGFINTGYPADAVLLAGGGATTLSGLYKHCCTCSIGVGPEIVTTGLFTSSTISYYATQMYTVNATVVTLTFSVPASLPTLNEATIKNGTYKIDVTSYRTNQNGYEDRAWCIHSISTNSVVIILSGTWLNANEGTIISVTKRI